MAIWLVRAGAAGQFEDKFLKENKVYLTSDRLSEDLTKIKNKLSLFELIRDKYYPDKKPGTLRNWTGQIWPFVKEMKKGDLVIMPSKKNPSIHIAEITGEYSNVYKNSSPFYHFRNVKWIAKDIPRLNFDQDLLYSFGAFMTICRVTRNDAEKRILEMRKNNWKSSNNTPESDGPENNDLEQNAKDQIANYIIRKFKGHGMARIIDAIFRAQGYTTYQSPEGADKGIDLLAAPPPLGFGRPRICIQVKTSDTPIDRPTLDQLIGTMQNVNADQGLLVSWSGFKSSVEKEIASQFFRVRLWNQNDIINEVIYNYDKLDDEIKAELPLKRIWALTLVEDTD